MTSSDATGNLVGSRGVEAVDVTAFGIRPDTGADMAPAVRRLLAACRGRAVSLVFPRGRYDFYQNPDEDVTIAFHLQGLKNLDLDGNGAEFVFHGLMMPVRIEKSEQVRLRNFTVDWERPFISQGRIVAVTDTHVDLAIDREQYPYVMDGGRIWFTSPDWTCRRGVDGTYSNLFDPATGEIVYRMRDNPLGMDFNGPSAEIAPGVVRFQGAPKCRPAPGAIVTLYHGRYIVKGIDIVGSRDITLKNLTLHHVLSGGVVAARTDGLALEAVNIVANTRKGRVFSGIADGFHFIHCRGHVAVRDCVHRGNGDDFLNLHGRNSLVLKRVDARTVRVIRAECTEAGDEVWLIRQADVQRREVMTVAATRRVPISCPLGEFETKTFNGINPAWGLSTDKQGEWEVTFTEPLPEDFREGDVFENKTWNASLTMTGCRILRCHRARGVLVTTPAPVVIEHNFFQTAGTAILIEGDTDHWYESGANTDVLIRGNVFADCLTSGSESARKWQWGEAVVTITPSHAPQGVDTEPYHRNIRLERNTFKTFDIPLVRARSVRGLEFRGNTVERTRTFAAFAGQKAAFWLDGCREVRLGGNRYDDAYEGRVIWTEHMREGDLAQDGEGRVFTVVPRPERIP